MRTATEERHVSDGARALKEWLEGPPKRRQADLAASLGVGQQTVSAWLRGAVIPSVLYRVKLKTIAGILPASWLPPSKQEAGTLSPEEEQEILSTGTEGGS